MKCIPVSMLNTRSMGGIVMRHHTSYSMVTSGSSLIPRLRLFTASAL